ncbi:hypothetical protein [Diaphorobacter caeni]|uniref:hypothetical protein n=1 Tax=Diaphorobacter caeni TaxID=2784387 RepID=UPI0018905CC6|nr:hypothetical protein [Diaphorobacter caeni]MBF5005423.1 hypothetical protein [Diaphorobacter caeni]
MASFDQSPSRSSNWRRMRVPCREDFQQSLKRRNSLTLHGWVIGLFMMSFMWAMSRFQWMLLGDGSLALRYLVTLGSGYLVYLLVLHEWSKWILIREEHEGTDVDIGDALDIADAVTPRFDGNGLGDVASGALDGLGAADEGAIVVVPVVAIFVAVVALVTGAGALMWLYFGSEVLLAVAVELAFSVATARALMGAERAGWITAAVRLTWKPLLGALVCAVALGWVIDHYLPEAQSLPHAVRLWRGH